MRLLTIITSLALTSACGSSTSFVDDMPHAQLSPLDFMELRESANLANYAATFGGTVHDYPNVSAADLLELRGASDADIIATFSR